MPCASTACFGGLGVGVKAVQHALLDRLALAPRRPRVVLQPLVGAQRPAPFHHRHGAVFQRDAGVLGLRAFLVGDRPHQAGQEGRGRAAVVDRGDAFAPHQGFARTSAAASSRQAKCARPPLGPRPVCKVDPAQPRALPPCSCSTWRSVTWLQVGLQAAVEDALWMIVCCRWSPPAARQAVRGDVALQRRVHLGRRRPARRHQQRRDGVVAGLAGSGCEKSWKLRLRSTFSLRGAAPPREAPGVERVDVSTATPLACSARCAPYRRAARAARPSRSNLRCRGSRWRGSAAPSHRARPSQRHVHRQRLAVAPSSGWAWLSTSSPRLPPRRETRARSA